MQTLSGHGLQQYQDSSDIKRVTNVQYQGFYITSAWVALMGFPPNITDSYVRECPKNLLPTRSEEREVLGVWSIPVTILPTCQHMTIIALQLHNVNIVG